VSKAHGGLLAGVDLADLRRVQEAEDADIIARLTRSN